METQVTQKTAEETQTAQEAQTAEVVLECQINSGSHTVKYRAVSPSHVKALTEMQKKVPAPEIVRLVNEKILAHHLQHELRVAVRGETDIKDPEKRKAKLEELKKVREKIERGEAFDLYAFLPERKEKQAPEKKVNEVLGKMSPEERRAFLMKQLAMLE